MTDTTSKYNELLTQFTLLEISSIRGDDISQIKDVFIHTMTMTLSHLGWPDPVGGFTLGECSSNGLRDAECEATVKVGQFEATVMLHAQRRLDQDHTWKLKFGSGDLLYADSGPEVLSKAFLNAVKKVQKGIP